MSRRQIQEIAPVFALCGVLLFAGCAPKPPPPNVLLVVVDTLRQDHLPCYGYHRDTSPTLCRLAAEGASFDGIAPSSWTKPSTASILTGLHPLRHQAIERNDRLPASVQTLAEILADRGFTGLGLSANGWISPQFGFDRGFEKLLLLHGRAGPADASELNEALFSQLDALTEPWFLYLHYVDPHEPYDPPAGWDGKPLAPDLAALAPITKQDMDMANFVVRDPVQVQAARDLYDGEIRESDARLAEVLTWLADRGHEDSTLTVVVSDHGEEFDEHGRVGHGMNLHREVMRVPMVFHYPAAIPPKSGGGQANLLDVTPTILDLLGIPKPRKKQSLDGRSLLPEILADGPDNGAGQSEAEAERSHFLHMELDGRPSLALLRGDTKLVLADAPYEKALFDQEDDPEETRNLLDDEAESDRFGPWVQSAGREVADEYNRLRQLAPDRVTTTTAGQAADVIQALGYLSPTSDSERPRLLPHRVRPTDDYQGGLRGWEPLNEIESCVELQDPGIEGQLLEGWRFIEPKLGGRWTMPRASLVLASPPDIDLGTPQLLLDGANYRSEPFEISVLVGSETVAKAMFHPGIVKIDVPVARSLLRDPTALVRIESSPPYLPQPPRLGKAHWQLGLVVSSVCLRVWNEPEPEVAPAFSPDSPGPGDSQFPQG